MKNDGRWVVQIRDDIPNLRRTLPGVFLRYSDDSVPKAVEHVQSLNSSDCLF